LTILFTLDQPAEPKKDDENKGYGYQLTHPVYTAKKRAKQLYSGFQKVTEAYNRVLFYPPMNLADWAIHKVEGTEPPQKTPFGPNGTSLETFRGRGEHSDWKEVYQEHFPEWSAEKMEVPGQFWRAPMSAIPDTPAGQARKAERIAKAPTRGELAGTASNFGIDIGNVIPFGKPVEAARAAVELVGIGRLGLMLMKRVPYISGASDALRGLMRTAFTEPLASAMELEKIDQKIAKARALAVPETMIKNAKSGILPPKKLHQMSEFAKDEARKLMGVEAKPVGAADELDDVFKTKDYGIPGAKRPKDFVRDAETFISRAADGTLDYEKAAKQLNPEQIAALKRVEAFTNVHEVGAFYTTKIASANLKGKLSAAADEVFDDYGNLVKYYARLKKKDPKMAEQFLELWEHGQPISKNGRWGLSEKFYKTFKEGYGDGADEVIERLQSEHVGAMVHVLKDDQIGAMRELSSRLDAAEHIKDWQFAYETPEFLDAMHEFIAKTNDPNLANLFDSYVAYKTSFAKIAEERGIMNRAALERFAKSSVVRDEVTGIMTEPLNHIKHLANSKKAADEATKVMFQHRQKLSDKLGLVIKDIEDELTVLHVPKDEAEKQLGSFYKLKEAYLTGQIEKLSEYDEKIAIDIATRVKDIANRSTNPGKLRMLAGKLSNELAGIRSFREIYGSVKEINATAGYEMFETNMARLLFEEELKFKRVQILQDYLNQAVENSSGLVKKLDKIPDKIPDGFGLIQDDLLGNFIVHKDILPSMKAIVNIETGKPGWAKALDKAYGILEQATSAWKYQVTIPFIKFSNRNFGSSLIMMENAGFHFINPEDAALLKEAGELWLAGKRGTSEVARKLRYQLIEKNVFRSGFQYMEALDPAKAGIIGGMKQLPGVKQTVGPLLTNVMEPLAEAGDDIPKLALWLKAKKLGPAYYRKYGNFRTPEDFVNKFMPAYKPGTTFEKRFMGIMVDPFYRWMRYNVPLTIEMMAKNPRYYSMIEKGRKQATALLGGAEPKEWAPDYVKEGYPIGVGFGTKGPEYFLLNGWIAPPSAVFFLDKSEFKNMIYTKGNPLIKKAIEVGVGREFRKGFPKYERYPGEREKLYGMYIPKRLKRLATLFRIVSETDRLYFPTQADNIANRIVWATFGKSYEVDMEKGKKALRVELKRTLGNLEKDREDIKKDMKIGKATQGQLNAAERKIVKHKQYMREADTL
jgi:hypothetical protein